MRRARSAEEPRIVADFRGLSPEDRFLVTRCVERLADPETREEMIADAERLFAAASPEARQDAIDILRRDVARRPKT